MTTSNSRFVETCLTPQKALDNISFCLINDLFYLSWKYLKYVCKFRTSDIKFPFEVGRWYDIPGEKKLK